MNDTMDFDRVVSMRVGDDCYIRGITGKLFHDRVSTLRKDNPELAMVAFRTFRAFGGVIVERVPDRVSGRSGDKYGVKTLGVGEERQIAGADTRQFSQYLFNMRKRYEELKPRKFKSWNIYGGIVVRRTE